MQKEHFLFFGYATLFYGKSILMTHDLGRFEKAQAGVYETALAEIKSGKKKSHWMWFIFPQIRGLGNSEMAANYAIQDLQEAEEYLNHPILGKRLIELRIALLRLPSTSARDVFGSPDDLKLRSCMTLFSLVPTAPRDFSVVLRTFFDGDKCEKTLSILVNQAS
jgi:uncharacterized protein (DUF1810 family)